MGWKTQNKHKIFISLFVLAFFFSRVVWFKLLCWHVPFYMVKSKPLLLPGGGFTSVSRHGTRTLLWRGAKLTDGAKFFRCFMFKKEVIKTSSGPPPSGDKSKRCNAMKFLQGGRISCHSCVGDFSWPPRIWIFDIVFTLHQALSTLTNRYCVKFRYFEKVFFFPSHLYSAGSWLWTVVLSSLQATK